MFNLFDFLKKTPIVVVSCLRDIHLLSLQAQSIHKHLSPGHDIYVIVNEKENVGEWNLNFDRYCKDWYSNHNLIVLYKKDFDCYWSHNGNRNYRGWEDQQMLKLAVSKVVGAKSYLVLDSQNFLIKSWNTKNYPIKFGKVPSRTSNFTMSKDTYHEYCSALEINPDHLDNPLMSISTPIFLKTSLVLSLIEQYGGLKEFSKTFFNFAGHPSEFLLYFLWAEKQGGFYKHHYNVTQVWNGPMVRQGFDDWKLETLFNHIGNRNENWISITHGSWKSFGKETHEKLSNLLKKYNLDIDQTGL